MGGGTQLKLWTGMLVQHVEFTLIHFNSAMLDVLLKDVIGGKM